MTAWADGVSGAAVKSAFLPDVFAIRRTLHQDHEMVTYTLYERNEADEPLQLASAVIHLYDRSEPYLGVTSIKYFTPAASHAYGIMLTLAAHEAAEGGHDD